MSDSEGAVGLRVIESGLKSTVQDLGREGYRAWGVPVGGAFDVWSHSLANALLGNDPTMATVEMTLLGGLYEAVGGPLAMAIAGADMDASIVGGRLLKAPQSFTLEAGQRLRIGGARAGARLYLGTRGGWRTGQVLGSRSSEKPMEAGAFLPCESGRTLTRRVGERSLGSGDWAGGGRPGKGERHPLGESREPVPISGAQVRAMDSRNEHEIMLRVIDGPDAAVVPEIDWAAQPLRVGAASDRMGLRLEGARLEVHVDPDRLSSPVVAGAVQWTGQGLIVLGVAGGTMGGYPVVACVIGADLERLAQARPGANVRLERIGLEEARGIGGLEHEARARRLATIRVAVSDSVG